MTVIVLPFLEANFWMKMKHRENSAANRPITSTSAVTEAGAPLTAAITATSAQKETHTIIPSFSPAHVDSAERPVEEAGMPGEDEEEGGQLDAPRHTARHRTVPSHHQFPNLTTIHQVIRLQMTLGSQGHFFYHRCHQ
ncbi:hypothetical protein TEQG_01858 [Trichophyton equinum CBS 127.97]|uniref:Uncharacterized protein n=1 Tax=Trichophyton equinum (strain ATCC MYA-4606 / CBS 127.97) TaxID=559882 RepID=F2PLQ3_TRIEC|nr:hypothetical protein TEQG_01858 [Trichophyton equinum CBS 127.97]